MTSCAPTGMRRLRPGEAPEWPPDAPWIILSRFTTSKLGGPHASCTLDDRQACRSRGGCERLDGQLPHARSGRAPTALERPPQATAPPGRSKSLRVIDRRARRSSQGGRGALDRRGARSRLTRVGPHLCVASPGLQRLVLRRHRRSGGLERVHPSARPVAVSAATAAQVDAADFPCADSTCSPRAGGSPASEELLEWFEPLHSGRASGGWRRGCWGRVSGGVPAPEPVDRAAHRRPVRGRLERPEGGLELRGIRDEGPFELVQRLVQLS